MNDYKKIKSEDYDKLSSKEGRYKIIEYYSNGNISYENYFINGKYHREDGPAITSYFENGNVMYEQYFINGKYHREDGPSDIWYDENGNIEYENYDLCDKEITKKDYYSPKIRAILDIAKDINTWESKFNFIELSLKKELNE